MAGPRPYPFYSWRRHWVWGGRCAPSPEKLPSLPELEKLVVSGIEFAI